MSEQLFDVVFFGILQAGKDKEVVMQNMATLFKTDAAKLTPYFAGGRKVIKGKINAATAEKYQHALENIGLVIKVEECDTEQSSTKLSDEQQQSQEQDKDQSNDEEQIDTSGISVAPVGADILDEAEDIPAQIIDDISDLSMAKTGTDIIENPIAVTPQKIEDTSNISMAEVGSDVLENPPEIIAQKIGDISEISMAEAGADIIENPKPKEKAEIPDTSELSLNDNQDQA